MNPASLWVRLYGDDSPGAAVVRVNQVLELAKSIPAMAAGNIINSSLVAGLFYTTLPQPLLAGWVALVWLLSAARLRSWWRNRRRARPSTMGRRPLVRSTFWSAAAGAVWGLMGFILLQYHEMPLHLFVAFVVGGQAAAAAIWIAPLPAAGLAYILLSLIPVVAGFAMEGDFLHLSMAGMLMTYTGVLTIFMVNTHKKFVHAILSGFERERLVVRLETAHAELEERVRQRTAELSGINRRLEKEIEERALADEELRESRDQLRLITDHLPVLISYMDPEQRFVFVNNCLVDWYGRPREEILGRQLKDLVGQDSYEKFAPGIEAALAGNMAAFEEVVEYPDGTRRNVDIKYVPDIADDGKVRGYFGLVVDITDRKRVEEALRESESQAVDAQSRLMDAIESIPEGFIIYDADERFVLCNSRYRDFYPQIEDMLVPGAKLEDVARTAFERGAVLQAVNNVEEWLDIRLREHRLAKGTHEQQLSDGRWLLCAASKTSGGDTVGIRTDISQLKQQEEQFRTSERRYHTLASSVPVGIFRTDVEGRCLYVNERWCQITGLSPEEASGDGWGQAIHPEDREELFAVWSAAVQAGAPFQHEYRFLHPDGTTTMVLGQAVAEYEDSERIAGYVGSITDITESSRLEEQLRQSQKMEAVGQLAGGVAHDFNNMLQIIMSYVHLARSSLDSPENLPKYLDNIGKSADRAANLTRQLLTFSRKDVLQPKILDVNELISNLMKMLGRLLGENIEMEILPGSDLSTVNADPGMLEQVLVNLSVNARDAMPGGGKLMIETSAFYADEDYCRIHGWRRPGEYLLIVVSDTGEGMTAQVREHIFEPFYTTKKPGKGTGLGLSMVYSIIKQHDGIVTVDSEPGVGTSFRIYLPAIEGETSTQEEQEAREAPSGTETVLIAEDEESVRELLSELLQAQGYRVLLARDGEQAVSLYRSRKEPIDLVIMDVVMPKLSGRKAFDQIRGMDSRIPVIFSTGYAANTLDRDFLEQNGLRVIHKPYTPALLYQAVREAIDGASESSRTSSRTARSLGG